jgi:hypothetical protein
MCEQHPLWLCRRNSQTTGSARQRRATKSVERSKLDRQAHEDGHKKKGNWAEESMQKLQDSDHMTCVAFQLVNPVWIVSLSWFLSQPNSKIFRFNILRSYCTYAIGRTKGDSFPEGKAAGAWRYACISIKYPILKKKLGATGCPLCRSPNLGSFIKLKSCIRRDILQ